MVQTLDVISVNLWQILISLANLLILFLLIKKFLYKPVKKVLAKRQEEIATHYIAAEEAERSASESKEIWERKISGAKAEADEMIANAAETAKNRGEKILTEAKERAEGILRQAEIGAELAYKKAEEDIKREIVEVSGALAEKMLEREISAEDHRNLIDSFIGKIGDNDDGDQ